MRKIIRKIGRISIALSISAFLPACGASESSSSAAPPDTPKPKTEPNETTAACVSSSTDKTSHAVSLQRESDHFYFHCAKADSSALDDIVQILESNCLRITSAFHAQIDEKITVCIYPDLDAFHTAIGRPNAPVWLVGTMENLTSIKMVSPNNPGPEHDYDSIICVALHEFVHIAASRMNFAVPDILSEGIATYMSGQNQGVAEAVSDLLAANTIPSYSKLKSISEWVYQFGYAYIEYIVTEHGYEKLVEFYKSPNDIEGVFGISEDDFQASWIEYLKTAY